MFFHTWWDLLRIVVVGALAYGALIALLRVSGKRTLAKMNAFDLVVTVALGSTLATALLSSDVALAESVLAFVLLCTLQYTVATLSVRSQRFRKIIKSEPALLLRRGEYLHAAMRRERVTEDEIDAAIRGAGRSGPGSVAAVVLETDGSFTVIPEAEGDPEPMRLRVEE